MFVLDREGKPIIRLYGHIDDRADMDRLVAFLGLPCDGPDRLVLATELDAMDPGIVPWHQARPVEFAIVGVSIAVGFAVILTIALRVVPL